MRGTVKRLFKKIGVRGCYVDTRGWYGNAYERWVWEAPAGTYMNWAQDLGRVWKDPRFSKGYQSRDRQVWSLLGNSKGQLSIEDNGFVIKGWEAPGYSNTDGYLDRLSLAVLESHTS